MNQDDDVEEEKKTEHAPPEAEHSFHNISLNYSKQDETNIFKGEKEKLSEER